MSILQSLASCAFFVCDECVCMHVFVNMCVIIFCVQFRDSFLYSCTGYKELSLFNNMNFDHIPSHTACRTPGHSGQDHESGA